MKHLFASAAVALTLVLGGAANAQENPTIDEFNLAVEDARTILQAEHKLLVSENLGLTAAEAESFWPVYDAYAAELDKAGDRRVKLITDFAGSFGDLSDETAKQLVADMLRYQKEVLKIREKYAKKFHGVLPATKVARLYQIENKLDALVNFALASEIPLVPVE
jgi:polyhydroxyalkanoate synthesis regulator phasin